MTQEEKIIHNLLCLIVCLTSEIDKQKEENKQILIAALNIQGETLK